MAKILKAGTKVLKVGNKVLKAKDIAPVGETWSINETPELPQSLTDYNISFNSNNFSYKVMHMIDGEGIAYWQTIEGEGIQAYTFGRFGYE